MISKVSTYLSNRTGYESGAPCSTYDREEATGQILQRILGRTGAIHAELDLLERCGGACRDSGLVLARPDGDWQRRDEGTVTPWPAHRHGVAGNARETLPLTYAGRPMGTLCLTFLAQPSRDCVDDLATSTAREAALALTRHELSCRARERLNLELLLAGHSRVQYALEAEIEKVSAAQYPVLLHADFGASPARVAAAIHLASSRRECPFVTLDCAYRDSHSFAGELEESFRRAGNGTLFLADADMLDMTAQRHLLRVIRQAKAVSGSHASARFIVSTQHPLDVIAEQGRFCRMLRSELDYLRIRIPPLSERREDVVPFLEEWFRRCSHDGVVRGFSVEARQACLGYDWPENESEAERVAARLAVMSDELLIGIEQLRQVVSWLPLAADGSAKQAPSFGVPIPPGTIDALSDLDADLAEPAAPDTGALEVELGARMVEQSAAQVVPAHLRDLSGAGELAYEAVQASAAQVEEAAVEVCGRDVAGLGDLPSKLADRDYSSLHTHEMGVQRALRYVGNHYTEEISLGRLARESYISSSHLSFLLKRSLGVPFKSLLAAVRIRRAQQLLALEEHSITEISLEVGFGDLSHFERTFKRIVGTNPREYRRRELIGRRPPIERNGRYASSGMSQR